MNKIKWLGLNVVSLMLIVWIGLTAWQYQKVVVPTGNSDYTTFLVTLYQAQDIYRNVNFTSLPAQTSQNEKPKTTNIQSINLNTPLLSLLLFKLINYSNILSINIGIWIGLSVLGAALGIWILLTTFPNNHQPIVFLPLLFIFLLSGYSIANFTAAQVSFFIFPILCLAYRFCCKDNNPALAITLGLLAATKLFFLIFIFYFLTKKAWQPLFIMLISFITFFFLPLFYFGAQTYSHFFSLDHSYLEFISRAAFSRNGSILGFIANLSYFLHSKITLLQLRYIAYAVVIYILIRSIQFDNGILQKLPIYSGELRFSFYIMIGLLCSPLAWNYYFVFLIIPLIVFFKVNEQINLNKLFYVCLFIALTIGVISISIVDIKHLTLFFPIRQTSTFTALVFWLFTFLIVVSHIRNQRNHRQKTHDIFLPLYILSSIFVIGYTAFAKVDPYFINSRNGSLVNKVNSNNKLIVLESV